MQNRLLNIKQRNSMWVQILYITVHYNISKMFELGSLFQINNKRPNILQFKQIMNTSQKQNFEK